MMKRILAIVLIALMLTSPLMALEELTGYTLAVGDKLMVNLVNKPELKTEQTVAPDGTLSFPLVGRVAGAGKTLVELEGMLAKSFGKYIESPQVTVFVTPRPIYVVQHDLGKNTWTVLTAGSVTEARALAGDYQGEIHYGDIVNVDVGSAPDWMEQNWYKLLTATGVVIGIYTAVH